MLRQAYDKRVWRALPRDYCLVRELLGEAAGPCQGLIHRHHVDPTDEFSRTIEVCNRHHGRLHGVLRALDAQPAWKTCRHTHRTREGREACERRLNARAA